MHITHVLLPSSQRLLHLVAPSALQMMDGSKHCEVHPTAPNQVRNHKLKMSWIRLDRSHQSITSVLTKSAGMYSFGNFCLRSCIPCALALLRHHRMRWINALDSALQFAYLQMVAVPYTSANAAADFVGMLDADACSKSSLRDSVVTS